MTLKREDIPCAVGATMITMLFLVGLHFLGVWNPIFPSEGAPPAIVVGVITALCSVAVVFVVGLLLCAPWLIAFEFCKKHSR